MVSDGDTFLRLAELGEQLANLEKNDAAVENILGYDYDSLLGHIHGGFHLKHSRSAAKNPYDEEREKFIVHDEVQEIEIKIYCPMAIQRFTVAGYNVVKDCWLKFHSYRFIHREFTREDFKELLDLFNKIATQIHIVSVIDDIIHDIIRGDTQLFTISEE